MVTAFCLAGMACSRHLTLLLGCIVLQMATGFTLPSPPKHMQLTAAVDKTADAEEPASPPQRRRRFQLPMRWRELKSGTPKRIGLMVEPTPFTHVSGYSNRFNEMLKYLKKAGDEVEVITPDNLEEAPDAAHGFKVNNIKGFTFPMYPLITLALDLRMRTFGMLRNFKPDLMHVSSPGFLCFAGVLASKLMQVPLVLSYHTHLPIYARNYGTKSWPLKWLGADMLEVCSWKLIRMVHSNADLTLVTSPQMQDELMVNGVERVDVWRKGIDTERFNPKFKSSEARKMLTATTTTTGNEGATKNSSMSSISQQDEDAQQQQQQRQRELEQPLLLYVGRLGMEKRLRDLKQVLVSNPSYRLAMVGKGPDEEALKEHFKGLNAVFCGQMSGDALSSAFASADVFVMPSDSETLGFVVLEAMASGVPVVGARAGGIPSLLDDGKTGYLAEPGNAEDFSAKIALLLKDPTKRARMAKAAREEAERWDWESATAYLRNVNYVKAVRNFNVRAGAPATLVKYCRDRTVQGFRWFTQHFADSMSDLEYAYERSDS